MGLRGVAAPDAKDAVAGSCHVRADRKEWCGNRNNPLVIARCENR
jgi:hypothetical protein